MSTAVTPARTATSPLVEGDHLDQPEFHRRYEAMPPGVKAELIDGVVSMPSPVGRGHAKSQFKAIAWLSYYSGATPGVEGFGELTVILGHRSELQPDAILRILPEYGGTIRSVQGYLTGAPEFVVEVSRSSRFVDLGPKLADYARAGVAEYLVLALDPDEIYWFRLHDGALRPVAPDADGLFRSTAFPGLWLDPQALLAGDLPHLRAVVDLGLATPDHAAFVARLAAARAQTSGAAE